MVKTNNKRRGAKKQQINSNRRQQRSVPKQKVPQPFIPHCVKEYAAACADPWNAAPCCKPDDRAIRSYKTRIRSRGTFTIGTQGMGFLVCSTVLFADTGKHSLFKTDASFAGVTVSGPGPTGVDPVTVPKPYTPSSGVVGRAVTAGCRISYTGTELNRSGQIYANAGYGSGTHVMDGFTASQLGTFESTKILRPDANRSWVGVVKRNTPFDDQWTELSISTYSNHTFGFIVTGVPGETYAYDFAVIAEYAPAGEEVLVPSLTESYSAPDQTRQVASAFTNARGVLLNAGSSKPSFLQKIEGAVDNIPGILDTVSRYVSLGTKALEMASMAL